MKTKFFVLILTAFPFVHCFSQISIGQSDMPNAGDTLRISYSTDTINPSLTGANYTWNYSFLNPNSQWLEKFDSPSSFAFPFNLLFNVFNTSYGQAQYTPDSIPGVGIAMDNAYGFFKKSSATLKQNGLGLSINSLPVPFDYNPDDVVYNFPLNYGDKDSCDSEFGPPSVIPLPFYYGQKIHRVNEVDGWGTLTTPYGTFPSLRIKTLISIRDTFSDSSGVFAFAFDRPLAYEYKWLKTGGKIPYLQINATDVAGNQVVTQIAYRDSMRAVLQVGVNENVITDLQMQLFPNPARDYAFVQYMLQGSQEIRIELLDINGKMISTIRNTKQASGPHIEIINLRNLNIAHGTYFVCLYSGNTKTTKQLVVQR